MCLDACQYSPGIGIHQLVCMVRTLNLSRMISSTHSQNNVLRVELDSHADTCIECQHTLVIHKHPKVVMVSGFDPSQLA